MLKTIKPYIYHKIKAFYAGDKYLYHRSLSRNFDFSKPLVLIYTMGKVGSTSVYESLKNNTSQFNVIHVHTLSSVYLKVRERFIKKVVYKNKYYARHIYTTLLWKPIWVRKSLKKVIKPIHIVTVIREPIGRNISLFFQWLEFEERQNTYVFKSRNNNYPFHITTSKDDLTELYIFFLECFAKESHNDWLQDELNSVFDYNILQIPFDKKNNFTIYENNGHRLLILKLEKMNDTFEPAIAAFLAEEIAMSRANEASTKNINLIYKKFKTGLYLPESYIDTLYASEYVNHFYTIEEIESFKSKWKTS
ncbi:putative capsular polysaccharide synthesis family protein [Mesoflavibacter zeaxanthinifaciens]|uniref:putative capsular polysaccharide synthesis family protein n=1 Tax=Mesoflavibacter zeaxanthinifaciens TaxID=393060 RepID=UPI003A8DB5CC